MMMMMMNKKAPTRPPREKSDFRREAFFSLSLRMMMTDESVPFNISISLSLFMHDRIS
jgi:hypothetical protein